MKNHYSTLTRCHWLKTLLLVFFASLTTAANAQDGSSAVDFGKMALDKEYQVAGDFNDYKGYFVAEKTGTLTATASFGCLLLPYTDPECLQAAAYNHIYLDNGESFSLDVEAGKTYYLFLGFSMSDGNFKLSMDTDKSIKLLSSTPANGSVFDVSEGGIVSVQFNNQVNVASVMISCNQTMTEIPYNVQGTDVAIDIKNRIFGLMENGNLKEGDQFAIILDGITSLYDENVIYGEDGSLVLTYQLGKLPVTLDSTVNVENNPFLSYWSKDNEKGIIKLIFNGELMSHEQRAKSGVASITYGELESESSEYYSENVPYTIQGKELTIDLTGKLRRAKDMVASASVYPTINIKVKDIRSADGRYAYFPGKGGLGSYSFDMAYQEVKAEPVADFVPSDGSTLDGQDFIEIWVLDYKTIQHDGVMFSFETDGKMHQVVVTDFEVKADTENEGAYLLKVKVPEEVKNANRQTDVKVSFSNLQCIDGLDHSADLTATYRVATGIKEVVNGNQAEKIYQMNGVKVNGKNRKQLPNGLYIVNGKKVLVNHK